MLYSNNKLNATKNKYLLQIKHTYTHKHTITITTKTRTTYKKMKEILYMHMNKLNAVGGK